MAGANITYDLTTLGTLSALQAAADALGSPRALLQDIGESLLHSTQDRFTSQTDPDGNAWAPLSPRYQRRKKKHADKILTLNQFLRNTLRTQLGDNEVLVGSGLKYAARHQFGGEFQAKARQSHVLFRQGKSGDAGRLLGKTKSAQEDRAAAGKVVTPARPFLGVSLDDEKSILDIAQDHLDKALGSRS